MDGVGGIYGDSKPATLDADRWASLLIRRLSRYAVTQHVMTNPKIEVNGDQANTVVYMQCRLFAQGWQPGDPIYDMGGYYTHHLVRTPPGLAHQELLPPHHLGPQPPHRLALEQSSARKKRMTCW